MTSVASEQLEFTAMVRVRVRDGLSKARFAQLRMDSKERALLYDLA